MRQDSLSPKGPVSILVMRTGEEDEGRGGPCILKGIPDEVGAPGLFRPPSWGIDDQGHCLSYLVSAPTTRRQSLVPDALGILGVRRDRTVTAMPEEKSPTSQFRSAASPGPLEQSARSLKPPRR